jgi:hypothetical protein
MLRRGMASVVLGVVLLVASCTSQTPAPLPSRILSPALGMGRCIDYHALVAGGSIGVQMLGTNDGRKLEHLSP